MRAKLTMLMTVAVSLLTWTAFAAGQNQGGGGSRPHNNPQGQNGGGGNFSSGNFGGGGGLNNLQTNLPNNSTVDSQTNSQNDPNTNTRGLVGGPVAQLGKAIFFDTNISNPPGMSCASCHAPETGFSYPNSKINNTDGTVPGVISSRFGNRKPMTLSYAWFVPDGPAVWNRRQQAWEGGFFSDGRASSLEDQASLPMTNPSEMNNIVHGTGTTDLVVQKVVAGKYTDLFKQAYGDQALTKSPTAIFMMIRESISEYEKSREVSPFSSKYDSYVAGNAELTKSEMNGLRLFTGSITGRPGGTPNSKNAQCSTCHSIADSTATNSRRDFFTNWTYANIGVPKNPHNPYYKQTNVTANPKGYNPDGDRYVDLGLGASLYPQRQLPPGNIGPGNNGQGDFLSVNGVFRVASLRNVDKRPNASFVKAYMHNGYFKSLKDVVHFYNTRNLTKKGEILDLASADPYANVTGKPNWPLPEYPSPLTIQNPYGDPNSPLDRVGNLGLTDQEETDIVAFLQTLSDGYINLQRRRPPPA